MASEEVVIGSPLTVSPLVESLLNSQHTQHNSISELTSYEVLLLSAPNTTLVFLFLFFFFFWLHRDRLLVPDQGSNLGARQ